jgi:hypothetical protein
MLRLIDPELPVLIKLRDTETGGWAKAAVQKLPEAESKADKKSDKEQKP